MAGILRLVWKSEFGSGVLGAEDVIGVLEPLLKWLLAFRPDCADDRRLLVVGMGGWCWVLMLPERERMDVG